MRNDGIRLKLIGGFEIARDGVVLTAPASRKTRALLAYLAVTGRAHRRQRLCDLLFELTDDPRAALRWSLTKIRPLVDGPLPRLEGGRETVALIGNDIALDVAELRATAAGQALASADAETLFAAAERFSGEFLAGEDIEHAPEFSAWIAAVREDCRAQQRRVLEAVLERSDDSPTRRLAAAQRLIAIDPFDEQAYAACVGALVELGRSDEARTLAAQAEASFRREQIGLSGALAVALSPRQPPVRAINPTPARTPRDKRVIATIAVFPFRPLGEEADARDWLVEGVIDGVTDALSRFALLRVLAPGVTRNAPSPDADPIASARVLGADYLLTGNVQISGDRQSGAVRIRYRLVVGASAAVAWSGSLERDLSDIFALQDEAAAEIANAIEPQIVRMRLSETVDHSEVDLEVYDYFLRGLSAAVGSGARDYNAAIESFRQALARDPDYAPALAYLPWAQGMALQLRTPSEFAAAVAMARKAVQSAGADARTMAMGAMSLVFLGRDFDTGLKAAARAMRLNPNDPVALACSGWIRATAGEFETPMEHFDRALQLNPVAQAETSNIHAGQAMCCLIAEDYGAAVRWANEALQLAPWHPSALFSVTAAAAGAGDLESARSCADRYLKVVPDGLASPVVRGLPFRRKGDRDRIFTLLRAAGVSG